MHKIWYIIRKTHNKLLPHISNHVQIEDTLYKRFINLFWKLSGLVLASSQIAHGYLVSPLATEQKAGVAKVAKGMIRGVRQVRSSEYLGITYQKDTKDIGSWTENLAMTFHSWVDKIGSSWWNNSSSSEKVCLVWMRLLLLDSTG